MTYEEKKHQASELLGDMRLALARKKRDYNRYIKHNAVEAAFKAAAQIAGMKTELQYEQELYDLTFNE